MLQRGHDLSLVLRQAWAKWQSGRTGDAKTVFKNYCDHVFGGQVWFDAINQLGACPLEFVEAWNAAINQRLEASFHNKPVYT